MKCIFLFSTELQSSYVGFGYNRAQLAHLAESHKREWLERINKRITELMDWKTAQERDLRDKYLMLRKLVNIAQA